MFGSAYAAAYYMKHALKFPTDKKVYVIGMEGMTEELDEQGISYVGAMVNISVFFSARGRAWHVVTFVVSNSHSLFSGFSAG